MKLKEFHLMVTEAMEKQAELADLDANKDSPARGWHSEFTDLLQDAVGECDE